MKIYGRIISTLLTGLLVVSMVVLFGCSGGSGGSTTPSSTIAVKDKFVSIPDDINCGFSMNAGMVIGVSGGEDGKSSVNGSVAALICQMSGKKQKTIPLVSTEITNGIMLTKEFGKLKVTSDNGSQQYSLAIDENKLNAFRKYLQE